MTGPARELLATARKVLAPAENDNRLVPLIASGQAPRSVFATIAAEESRIVPSDWRSFLTIAARCTEPNSRELFAGLAAGESLALGKLAALAAADGLDEPALRAYQPMAGCQAYPAYLAWLAMFGEPADVVVALIANFAAWGDYCGTIARRDARALRVRRRGVRLLRLLRHARCPRSRSRPSPRCSGRPAGTDEALTYGRLFQSYELMFWNTIADTSGQ